MRIRQWFAVVALATILAVLTFPRQTGLSMVTPIAQIVAFRGVLMVATGVLWLGVMLWLGVGIARRRRGQSSVVGRVIVAALVTVSLLGHLGTVWTRGMDTAARATPEMIAAAPIGDEDFTVVSINSEWDSVDPQWIAHLARSAQAMMVALPESERPHAERVAQALAAEGQPGWQVFATSSPWPNAMLISPEAGPYRLRPSDRQGLVIAEPASSDQQIGGYPAPVLVTVHATPPPSMAPWAPGHDRAHASWKRTVAEASQFIRDEPKVVAAGDFNATVDHSALDPGLRDATVGTSAWGTWPNWLPSWASARIDHVYAKPFDATRGSWVVDAPGSDHRAVVVRLSYLR